MNNLTNSVIKAYVKKDGETYFMFKVFIGINPLTGKHQYTTRRGYKTFNDAEMAYKQLLLEMQLNM